MRFTITLIAILLLFSLSAQTNYDLKIDNESLTDVVKIVSKRYGLKFSYSPRVLAKHKISKDIKAKSKAELISEIFEDLPFELKLTDGVYLVIPKKVEEKTAPLRGQVYDSESGEPLAFAHVQTEEKGTLSTQNGRFSLPPRKDTVTLKVSYIGYKDLELKVAPNEEIVTLRLNQNPQELKEVVLTSDNEKSIPNPSFFSLNPQQFSSLPMLGETDVFKSMQLLPGIQATDEASSGLVIRGSLPSQNLILMDGFTLYNVDHFFGIFSTFNPNAINNVSVYKGGFGSKYGGRISSVVDVSGKNGASEKFSGKIGANMLSTNGTLNIPIGERTSILFAFRNSFSDFINSDLYRDFLTSSRQNFLSSVSPELNTINISPTVEFGDINTKIQHRFSPNTVLDFNLFASEDFYQGNYIENDSLIEYQLNDISNWSNAGISLNLKSQLKPNWYNNTVISASEYEKNETLSSEFSFSQNFTIDADSSIEANTPVEYFNYSVKSSISDVTLKSHNEVQINHQNVISGGLEINTIATKYNVIQESLTADFLSFNAYRDTIDIATTILSLYGNYQFQKEDISTNIGLRTSFYEPTQKWYLEPRFDIGFKVSDDFILKGAASYHHQFISQTSLSLFQGSDQLYWVLSDDGIIPVQKSSHFILGGNYSLQKWSFDLEYYNKRTEGIIENQFLVLPPTILARLSIEELNLAGQNNSEGLDLFVKYKSTRFSSWLSFSIGKSEDSFWYRNQNTPYPSAQDQRYEVNFTNIFKVGKCEFSSTFLFGSGKPYTPINPAYSFENDTVSIYDLSRINQERLPSYVRLDLAAKYTFDIGKLNFETGLTLFNVLNKRNIRSRKFTRVPQLEEQDNQLVIEGSQLATLDTNLLGFTPNFFFNIRF